jgi:hypothetical protein
LFVVSVVAGVTTAGANATKAFPVPGGKGPSVPQHFFKKKGITLLHPEWPWFVRPLYSYH